MIRYQYSLTGLLVVVLVAALACGALLFPSRLWANSVFTLALAMLLYAIVAALFRGEDGRRFWASFAVFGWAYLILAFGPWCEQHIRPHLLTNDAVEAQYRTVQWLGRGPADLAVEQKLKLPVTLDFVETPLCDVIDSLFDYSGVNFVLDRPRLEEAGLGPDFPVSIRLQQVSLDSALGVLLQQIGLVSSVQEGVIMITTPASASKSSALIYLQRIGHSLAAIVVAFIGGLLGLRLAPGRHTTAAVDQ